MLSTEDNELLTHVGPGTPAGELFRRYWQPVAMLPELTDATPTKFVRILGEDLVLFRDKSGRVGLLGDHCPHRGASLLYGRVEERGIACAYHGWLYDIDGNCLETPAEPVDSKLHLTVKHKSYPVQELYGLYWAYLGPLPAPVLPRYDVTEAGPLESVGELPNQSCNWLQNMENAVDQAHIFILHQNTAGRGGNAGSSTARGFIDELVALEYSEAPFGIKRRQVRKTGYDDTDLVVFPAIHRIYGQFIVKVPIDDTHTREYHVQTNLRLNIDGERSNQDGPWASARNVFATIDGTEYYIELEGKTPPDARYPAATYPMHRLRWQDFMVMETQGPIAAREAEHLATSDRGVVLMRTMLKREIEKVQQGLDPLGVIRDPARALIDTYIHVYIDMVQRFPPQGVSGWGATAGAQLAPSGPSPSR